MRCASLPVALAAGLVWAHAATAQQLDLLAPPSDPAPAATAPAPPADAGPTADLAPTPAPAPTPASSPATSPAPPAPAVADAAPPTPGPLVLEHPQVIDAAHIAAPTGPIALTGISALPGDWGGQLQAFLANEGDRLTCTKDGTSDGKDAYLCRLPDGMDVARVALLNGVAAAATDAPAAYQDEQRAAQDARRGVWASLPPPPVVVTDPQMRDTATLTAGGKTLALFGIVGMSGHYARDMQGYIVAHGNAATCDPQPGGESYVCVLPDGTDLAKLALLNGAARVAPDAPDAYRVQQREALADKRGIWSEPDAVTHYAAAVPDDGPTLVAVAPGDEGDGISYVGGEPAAVIGGETVFLAFGGAALGWGYWDHWHHWHGAPDRFRYHMEHFHPEGAGLRGYHPGEFGPHGFRPGDPGLRAMHPEIGHPEIGHPGWVPGRTFAAERPGAPSFHPPAGGFPGRPPVMATNIPHGPMPAASSFVRPAGMNPGFGAGGMAHVGAPAFGGGAPHPAPPAAHPVATPIPGRH